MISAQRTPATLILITTLCMGHREDEKHHTKKPVSPKLPVICLHLCGNDVCQVRGLCSCVEGKGQ